MVNFENHKTEAFGGNYRQIKKRKIELWKKF